MIETEAGERILDVREIPSRIRHTVIFQLLAALAPEQSLQIVHDHDPTLLRNQLEFNFEGDFAWTYLESGPETWRVRLRRIGRRTAQ
ncbi:DUF2249 domain-containing protein [Propylenella binzhouense]|uniref:DUF2249 domain-containing protein n=1 Tax=Propylenella binzhouense TaxID=2555902 RepID=UPI00136E3014|nr:DUF2249 domain-containing protein [Propylenella binzhouense]